MAQSQAQPPAVLLDGSFDDWADGVVAQADPYHLYLQLACPEVIGLQGARVATHILLDLDDDASTGRKVTPGADDEAPLGVDLALLFAPEESRDARGMGGGAAALGGAPLAVASLHLKCCGAWMASEDLQRQTEAVTVNAALRRALADSPAVMAVVGGDFNLVGARLPKQTIASGLDLDGSNLAVATTLALGGHAATTWRDPRSRFPPSRLDYLLYSASSAQLVNAFALDTAVLDATSLRRHALRAEDSAFSDHLPIVIDLRRRSPP